MYNAIILSAGKGSRMKQDLPKGAFPILYRPMIVYAIDALKKANVNDINVVVGYKKEIIMDITEEYKCTYSVQTELNGTAKAVESAYDNLNKDGSTVILPVDMPLVNEKLINELISYHEKENNDLTVLSTFVDNPFSYGRIIRTNTSEFLEIKEELDCTPKEKLVNEINSGVYVVNTKLLFDAVKKVKNNNNKKEYYLTDIVSILKNDGFKVDAYPYKNSEETIGVNDLVALSNVESILRKRINNNFMFNGVYMINPDTITIGPDVVIGKDCVIEPNTFIYGTSIIGDGSKIGPNTEIFNSTIHDNCWVRHSIVFNSEVNSDTQVGPFAHIRMGSHVGKNNRIGNFVELKNSITGEDTKASHLGYIGDAHFGKNVNFGCGAITCNYDGKNKWRTVVKDNAFIGSNSNLIAPVTIEKDAFVGAGSTVTQDVPADAFAISRAKQVNKEHYSHVLKEKAKNKTGDINEG